MSKRTGPGFKPGDKVIACPQVMANDAKAGQLMSRTGLSAEELATPMLVVRATDDGQISLRHDRVERAFDVHMKFVKLHTPAPRAAQAA